MTTDELIRELRELPSRSICIPNDAETIMTAAADRLEELEERIAIMAADMDNEWGKRY